MEKSNPRRTAGKKKKKFYGKYFFLLVLIAVVFFIWFQKKAGEEKIENEIIVPVRTVQPTLTDMEKVFSLSAYIEAESMVTVFPKISGNLTTLGVSVGDEVLKNEVIAEIEKERYKLNLMEAEAAYQGAESTFIRTEKLFRSNAVSKQNYDEAKSRYEMADAKYKLAELQYGYTSVEAPITGVVLKKHTNKGALAAPEIPIITVADIKNLLVKADIPEEYYSFFADNKSEIEVIGKVPALNSRELPFRIKTVEPSIDSQTKTFKVYCEPGIENSGMKPGMFITMAFTLEERRSVYSLPHECLIAGKYVWYFEDNLAKRFEYSPNFSTPRGFQIPDAYKDFAFIVEGHHFLKEFQPVKVLP